MATDPPPTAVELQAAISAGIVAVLEGGQEYQLPDGRRVRRAELASLLKARAELTAAAAAEEDGCVMFQGPLSFGRE